MLPLFHSKIVKKYYNLWHGDDISCCNGLDFTKIKLFLNIFLEIIKVFYFSGL